MIHKENFYRIAAFYTVILVVVGMITLATRSYVIKRNNGVAMMNAHDLEGALLRYASQHGNRLPDAEHWQDSIQPYLGTTPVDDYTRIPHLIGTSPNRLIMNSALSGRNLNAISHPSKIVLLFQTSEEKTHGVPPAHLDGCSHEQRLIGYADGHVEQASCPLQALARPVDD